MLFFYFTDSASVVEEISIEVPQIPSTSDAAPSPSVTSEQAADEQIVIEVPQIPSTSDTGSLLDKKEDSISEVEIEEEKDGTEEEKDDGSDLGAAEVTAEDEADDQTALLPVADSILDLPSVDG